MAELEAVKSLLEESGDSNNPDPAELREIMDRVKTIAVIGISRNPEKEARRIPSYLASKGYDIIPVNPFVDTILGKEARDSLEEVDEPVDMVLVFRPSEEAAEIARLAMKRKDHPVIWLQKEIRADEVAEEARDQGITMVQDLCTYEVHKALAQSD